MPRTEKKVYLTFDDGPIPEITPFILDILKKYQAKATFF
ncbi:MAG: polysaccharide deacetylase family protein, partial [Sphingobacterium sp.]